MTYLSHPARIKQRISKPASLDIVLENSGTADNGIQRISGAAVKRLWAGNPRDSE